jgi:hypothetical protein
MTDSTIDTGKENLPPCGLYRTSEPLPGKEKWVKEQMLVYFHNHSEQGPPLILLPASNRGNKWDFHDKGYLVKATEYVDTMIPLKDEGYYVLRDPIHLSPEEFIPERTLVQLGYNRAGEPILFLSQFGRNSISFPEDGLKCTLDIFKLLKPVNFRIPDNDE